MLDALYSRSHMREQRKLRWRVDVSEVVVDVERNRTRVEDANAGEGSESNLIAPVDGEIVPANR
jgi:hypothetical protein